MSNKKEDLIEELQILLQICIDKLNSAKSDEVVLESISDISAVSEKILHEMEHVMGLTCLVGDDIIDV